jgi:hypothetical protein
LYRLFGPTFPPEGSPPLTHQVIKSAFELPTGAHLATGRTHTLRGRSWSGNAPIRHVDVSLDGGTHWQSAQMRDPAVPNTWRRWDLTWHPNRAGPYELLARATDRSGTTQPDHTVFNTQGYLFDAIVRHPVTVV